MILWCCGLVCCEVELYDGILALGYGFRSIAVKFDGLEIIKTKFKILENLRYILMRHMTYGHVYLGKILPMLGCYHRSIDLRMDTHLAPKIHTCVLGFFLCGLFNTPSCMRDIHLCIFGETWGQRHEKLEKKI